MCLTWLETVLGFEMLHVRVVTVLLCISKEEHVLFVLLSIVDNTVSRLVSCRARAAYHYSWMLLVLTFACKGVWDSDHVVCRFDCHCMFHRFHAFLHTKYLPHLERRVSYLRFMWPDLTHNGSNQFLDNVESNWAHGVLSSPSMSLSFNLWSQNESKCPLQNKRK